MPVAHDIFNKRCSGANLLTITGGHTLDLMEAVLGPIIEVDARTEIRWPIVKLKETGAMSVRETADYVGVAGKTRSGVAFTADIEAGVQPENLRFSFEVRGSEGWLSLTSTHPYGVQAGDLTLTSNVRSRRPRRPWPQAGSWGRPSMWGSCMLISFATCMRAPTPRPVLNTPFTTPTSSRP